MMSRHVAAVVVACLVGAVAAGAQGPTFRSGTSVVHFDVPVTDGRRPLTGLTGADFEVRDRGVLQSVDAVFGEQEPLDVLFAFDRSASTTGDLIARLRESARAIVATLGADDRAGLLAFNNRFALVAPLGPPAGLPRAIDALVPESGTALLDAASVAFGLTAASTRRTMILLFTDGADTLSWLPERLVIEQARSSDAVLYAVAMHRRGSTPLDTTDADNQLRRLGEATGGRLLKAESPDQLGARFLDLLAEMRARYVLTYAPSNGETPGWHDVQVRLKGRSGRVSTRAGYTVPAP